MRWVLPGGAILGESNREDNERTVACRPLAAVLEPMAPTRPHRLVSTAGGRRVSARYSEGRRLSGIPDYRQLDAHSCGFVAVLTVVHSFDPDIPPRDVLAAVRPSRTAGCDQPRVIAALKRFGVSAAYRSDLGPRRLHRLVECGTPVIVTVEPEDYCCDHWTVVRGVDLAGKRVFLTNCEYTAEDGGMSWDLFAKMWSPRGGGLVCRREGTAR